VQVSTTMDAFFIGI